MDKLKIVLIGGGGHCKSCIDVIELENKFEIVGILDVKERIGQDVLGYKIIDCDENLKKYIDKGNHFLITMGQIKSTQKRIDIFNHLRELSANIATIISPLSHVSKHSKIGEGTIIMHNVLVNPNVTIGKNCIINSKSLLEHDVTVGDNCHISTASVLNGAVNLGSNSFVGSNSTIVQEVEVPECSFIKAGILVK